jgi:hypothetical protein
VPVLKLFLKPSPHLFLDPDTLMPKLAVTWQEIKAFLTVGITTSACLYLDVLFKELTNLLPVK